MNSIQLPIQNNKMTFKAEILDLLKSVCEILKGQHMQAMPKLPIHKVATYSTQETWTSIQPGSQGTTIEFTQTTMQYWPVKFLHWYQ